MTRKELLKETKAKYICDLGYRLIELWKCQWLEMKNKKKDLQHFIATKLRRPFDRVYSASHEQILEGLCKRRSLAVSSAI